MTTTTTTTPTRKLILFRAKKSKAYSRKLVPAKYHISRRIKHMNATTTTLCGQSLYIDWATPFKTVEEFTPAIVDDTCTKCLRTLRETLLIEVSKLFE